MGHPLGRLNLKKLTSAHGANLAPRDASLCKQDDFASSAVLFEQLRRKTIDAASSDNGRQENAELAGDPS